MSERPVAVTRTDEILLHLVDRVEHLIGHLEDRDGGAGTAGAPDQPEAAPTEPAVKDATKKAPAKKTTSKRATADVDGR